jgi:hypothetical protein
MSDNNNRPAAAQAEKTGRLVARTFFGLTLCGGAIVLAAWVAYSAKLGSPAGAPDVRAAWGQLGDFIGGVTNPLLSFLALIALLTTVKLQSDQLDAAREELDESRRAKADAARQATERIAAANALAQAQERVAVAMERAAVAQELSASAVRDQLSQATELAAAQLRVAVAQEQATGLQRQQVSYSWISARLVALNAQLTQQFELLRSHEAMRANTQHVTARIGQLLAELDAAANAQQWAPLLVGSIGQDAEPKVDTAESGR